MTLLISEKKELINTNPLSCKVLSNYHRGRINKLVSLSPCSDFQIIAGGKNAFSSVRGRVWVRRQFSMKAGNFIALQRTSWDVNVNELKTKKNWKEFEILSGNEVRGRSKPFKWIIKMDTVQMIVERLLPFQHQYGGRWRISSLLHQVA